MIVEQIRARRRSDTFEPFAIRTVDGRRFDVPEREMVAISPTLRTVVVWGGEAFEILAATSIAGVEPLVAVPPSSKAS